VSDYKDRYFNQYSPLGKDAKALLVAWENSSKETVDLWSMMNGWVFDGFHETYSRMHIHFDHIDKESQTYLLGKEIVNIGLNKGIFEKQNDGSVIFDFNKIKELKSDRKKDC